MGEGYHFKICEKKDEGGQMTRSESPVNFRTIQSFQKLVIPTIGYEKIPKSTSIFVETPFAFIEEEHKLRLLQNGTAVLEIKNPLVENSWDIRKKILRYKCDFKLDRLKIALDTQKDGSNEPSNDNAASKKEIERLTHELTKFANKSKNSK